MKILIASDHAGYQLKQELIEHLKNHYQTEDKGTYSLESVDYPDYAFSVAKGVANKEADFGILICYTGIGMSMAANKVSGIRAALVVNVENARLTREHNNANVLCLSSKDTTLELAKQIADTFLTTEFLGGRHERRVCKIQSFEHHV